MASKKATRSNRVVGEFYGATVAYREGMGWLVSYGDEEGKQVFGTSDTSPGHPVLRLLGRGDRLRVRQIARAMVEEFDRAFCEYAERELRRPRLVR